MNSELPGLIAAVEDVFGFSMPESELAALDSVGAVFDRVRRYRLAGRGEACWNSMTVHRLQRAMMWGLRVARRDVRSSASVERLIPRRRRRAWRTLRKATGLRLPQLRRPPWVMGAAALAVLACVIAVPWALSLGLLNGAILTGLLTAFAAAHCLAWMTAPLATELQKDCATVGRLAEAVVARNFPAIVAEAERHPDEAQAWQTLQTIVAEHFGVHARDVTPEASLASGLVAAR